MSIYFLHSFCNLKRVSVRCSLVVVSDFFLLANIMTNIIRQRNKHWLKTDFFIIKQILINACPHKMWMSAKLSVFTINNNNSKNLFQSIKYLITTQNNSFALLNIFLIRRCKSNGSIYTADWTSADTWSHEVNMPLTRTTNETYERKTTPKEQSRASRGTSAPLTTAAPKRTAFLVRWRELRLSRKSCMPWLLCLGR